MRTILGCTTLLLAASLVLIALHFHDESRRYDVVGFAAGSGGAQDQPGTTTTKAYLVDHKTGRLWTVGDEFVVPTARLTCAQTSQQYAESELGCVLLNHSGPNK